MQITNAGNIVKQEEKYDADLDQALEVVGIGWYNIKYCIILSWLLIASTLDVTGTSLILPAAVCDLLMSDQQRGLIISIPFIGILLTSYFWGYLVDTRGRKNMLIYSSLGSGIFSLLAGLMPDSISFSICKFISSLCIACPSTAPYIFIGEMLPLKYRDVFLSVLNSIQLAGSTLAPLLAWAILPLDFRVSFGLYFFRPWRLLNIMYAILFIVIAILLTFSPESPKFLVTQDKFDEALKVLQIMYAGNKGKKPEQFPIKKLLAPPNLTKTGDFWTTLKIQTVPLFKWSYLKWVLLNGFLLFGIYAAGNGLNIWLPDIMNRVITGNGHGRTACEVILDRYNQTITGVAKCNDTLDQTVLLISFVARLCLTVLAVAASATVKYIGKKMLIILSMGILGIVCISVNMITNEMLFASLLSSIAILALAMGPINAYAVEIFPTNLRGKAVSLSMMVGRTGSVIGANWTAFMVNNSCQLMFYSFGGLLFLCSASALLLPKSKVSPQKGQLKDNGSSTNNTLYITKM